MMKMMLLLLVDECRQKIKAEKQREEQLPGSLRGLKRARGTLVPRRGRRGEGGGKRRMEILRR